MASVEGSPCPVCRTPLKALWSTTYCPRCEGKAADGAASEPDGKQRCPQCGSADVAPFSHWSYYPTFHCIDCGKVF